MSVPTRLNRPISENSILLGTWVNRTPSPCLYLAMRVPATNIARVCAEG
jgi:hypothetical protein